MKKSSQFKEVLVAAIGLTPQIITETLYWLTQRRKPPVIPSEIYALTTRRGKEKAADKLLGPSGKFLAFCREYRIDPREIRFDRDSIIVIKDKRGMPLDDVRTSDDNQAVADQIVDFIREKTRDPNTRLHCSIAGGRKTMGAYLALALQLFGRPQDVLFHVLVSEEFENHPEFYYKPRRNKSLPALGAKGSAAKKMLQTRDAKIELGEIPYVRLRERVIWSLDEIEGRSYSQIVRRAQREIDLLPYDLELDLRNRRVKIGEASISLPPHQMMLYAYLAKLKQAAGRLAGGRSDTTFPESCFLKINELADKARVDEMLGLYRQMVSASEDRLAKIKDRFTGEGFEPALRQTISKINKALARGLRDRALLRYYTIEAVGPHGERRYGIQLDGRRIKFAG